MGTQLIQPHRETTDMGESFPMRYEDIEVILPLSQPVHRTIEKIASHSGVPATDVLQTLVWMGLDVWHEEGGIPPEV